MDIRHLTFRLLQVYVQVVRLGSVSAAARALHLTQPTVSLQLKKLSGEIGAPLFELRQQQLQPTHVGQQLYQAACDVLGRFDDFSLSLSEAEQGTSGHLSLGIVTTASYVMPQILGGFYRQFPNIKVTLNVANRAQMLARFEQQLDDLYVFSHPPIGHTVQAARILKNPLSLIAPGNHPLCSTTTPLTINQLRQYRFLLREPGSATRLMFESWLSSQGIELGDTMQIENNEAIRLGVAAGLGLAVVSAHSLPRHHNDNIIVLDVAGFPLDGHWYLVRRKDRRLPQTGEQLVRFISRHLGDCVDPGWIVSGIEQLGTALGAQPA
ncbi:LysR family transcriptional regulator [Rheinheimera sp.]|uniref:LysR family transcriptional regulator n=1 Tax=Rheinheimera sp. TaxID=1869214 RepID=UPI002FDCFE8F